MEIPADDDKPATYCGFTINGLGYTVEPLPGRKQLALVRHEPGKGHIVGYVRAGEAEILKDWFNDLADFINGSGVLPVVGRGAPG